MTFSFGKKSRRRSKRVSRKSRRVSRKSRRVSRKSRRVSRKGRKSGGRKSAQKLFSHRIKQVATLRKQGMSNKQAWKKVMNKGSKSFGAAKIIPGF